MIITCENITAKYRPAISQRLRSIKSRLLRCPDKPKPLPPLEDFTHTFLPGVTILLGPNSAGKSTLLRLLAGTLPPAGGTICFDGKKIRPYELRPLISYLPQSFDFYPEFTAYEMLDYIALLKAITPQTARINAINAALRETNLVPAAMQKVKTYSRGMKQRLGIAQALLTSTPILLLDEPTAGLDPEERNKFRLLLSKLSQTQLVVFSSSILSDITCADTAVILANGHCRFAGTPAALAACAKPTVLTELREFSSFMANLQKGYRTVLSTGKY